MDLKVGSIIEDKFEILERIGAGGMGTVYKAKDLTLLRTFVLKILTPSYNSSKAFLRFQNEAKVLGKLQHPGIADIYNVGVTSDGLAYLALEYVDGITLEAFIESGEQLPIAETTQIFIEIADALSHAHRVGIVHRDIKPGNIMLVKTDDGFFAPILLDFGIAKFDTASDAEQRLTEPGTMIGSPLYMSPEQCKGETASAASDQYSLGCVLFECLAGEPPFRGDTAYDTALLHMTGSCPDPIAASRTPISEKLGKTIERMLAKIPEERFANTDELLKSLVESRDETIEEEVPISSGTEKAGIRKRLSIYAKWLACLAIFVVGGIGFYKHFTGSLPENTPLATPSIFEQDSKDSILSETRHMVVSLQPMSPNILKQLMLRNDLTTADFSHSNLTDEMLKVLWPSKKTLTVLSLKGTQITSLQFLPELKNLTSLNLADTNISDEALKNVVALQRLEVLDINSCANVTARSLATLEKLPRLRYVRLNNTAIREDDVKKLQRRLPRTTFEPYLRTSPVSRLLALAQTQKKDGNLKKSIETYRKAVDILCKARGPNCPQSCDLLLEAALAAIALEDKSAAEDYIEQANRCALESNDPMLRVEVLNCRINLSEKLDPDIQKRMALLREQHHLIKEAGQEQTDLGRDNLFKTATILFYLKVFHEAESLMNQCKTYDLRLSKDAFEDKGRKRIAYQRYGQDLNVLGRIAFEKRELGKAERYLKNSLKIISESEKSKFIEFQISELNYWLACAINSQGRPQEALEYMQVAVDVAKANNFTQLASFEKSLQDVRKQADLLRNAEEKKGSRKAHPAN